MYNSSSKCDICRGEICDREEQCKRNILKLSVPCILLDQCTSFISPPKFINDIYIYIYVLGRDSIFGIATRYVLDGLGIKSRWGRVFLNWSRLAFGPTQHPVQWLLDLSWGISSRGMALTTHPHPALRLKKE